MSKIEVNTVAPQCGTTLTLGENNDTVVLGTGAAFGGGVGAVKWETTPQTGSFQATAGRGYFMNTTSGALTVTTPASPTAGDIFAVSDYARTFQTNNLTIAPHSGAKIGGVAANAFLSTEGQTATFVYIDSTQGWINVQETSNSVTGNAFIVATGGTVTTCGNCKIHTFTGPGTFTVCAIAACSANNVMSHLVVAGGGSGAAAGGGAGGFREVKSPVTPYTASPLDGYPSAPNRVTVTAQAYPITVGGGGANPNNTATRGSNGSNSVFSTITSAGGGAGGAFSDPSPVSNYGGAPGGSGGGSGPNGAPPCGATFTDKGTGNTPPVSPAQGNDGGNAFHQPGSFTVAGGGGGATAVGANFNPGSAPGFIGGNGGAGATTNITGSPVAYAGGGGGGSSPTNSGGRSTGGTGGGGAGNNSGTGDAGTTNTGGGGGGSSHPTNPTSASGGSGIVIIRYKYQ